MFVAVLIVLIACEPFVANALPRLQEEEEDNYGSGAGVFYGDDEDGFWRSRNVLSHGRGHAGRRHDPDEEMSFEDPGRNEDPDEEMNPDYFEYGDGRDEDEEDRHDEIPVPLGVEVAWHLDQHIKEYLKIVQDMQDTIQSMLDEMERRGANTTEEEMTIDGQKVHVQESVLKDDSKNGSLFVEAISTVQTSNRTKRSNNDAEPNQ